MFIFWTRVLIGQKESFFRLFTVSFLLWLTIGSNGAGNFSFSERLLQLVVGVCECGTVSGE